MTPTNKIALVTGAARRIGRAIALALAQDGWDIVVHYRHSAAEAEGTVSDIAALGHEAAPHLSCVGSTRAGVGADGCLLVEVGVLD